MDNDINDYFCGGFLNTQNTCIIYQDLNRQSRATGNAQP